MTFTDDNWRAAARRQPGCATYPPFRPDRSTAAPAAPFLEGPAGPAPLVDEHDQEPTQADAIAPYFEILAMDDEHPSGVTGFVCNTCGRAVDDHPCPIHGPRDVPGLYRVVCEAQPQHHLWLLDGDHRGYGAPCPYCQLQEYWAKERAAAQCRHWPWRRRRITHWLIGWLYRLGITSTGGGWKHGDGCDGCLPNLPRLRGRRVYILGVDRDTWHCWRSGHRRGEPIGLGMCGTCVPWACCGAITVAHRPGCPEDDAQTPDTTTSPR